jgi:hypothetical protein
MSNEWIPTDELLQSNWFKASQAISQSALQQGVLNKTIKIKQPPKKGFQSGGLIGSSYNGGTTGKDVVPVFEVPPLNAIISSAFGKAANPKSPSFKLFSAPSVVVNDLQFLNWEAIGKKTFDDPNKHRDIQLSNFKLSKVFNQLCCGACWAVSTASTFSDRYGILNDELPIDGSAISIMTCCTREMHENVFGKVATPDCNIMSSYNELKMSNNSMGMCSGGIPYSAALSIKRNGLPHESKLNYNTSLFNCQGAASLPNLNKSIIDQYPCGEKMFKNNTIIKMDPHEEPVYISSALDSKGHPEHYVKLMKEALLEGGPIVGGFMVLGDFLGIGTTSGLIGASSAGENDLLSWDSTGKVYVPGAYDKMWPFIQLTSVGGSTTIQINAEEGKIPKVFDTGMKPKSAPGRIFCGFHAISIVGWGELDMKYVTNENVKSVKSHVDGKQKLPFWICRNSWGTNWPMKDNEPYYQGGVKVTIGENSKEEVFKLPPGYWLHAMYPNCSVAMDVPINYEGTDYGSTMVMTPLKSASAPKPTSPSRDDPQQYPSPMPGTLFPEMNCDNDWEDSEGYSCFQYKQQRWCTEDGEVGSGWKSEWGSLKRFSKDGKDALTACCECGAGDNNVNVNQDDKLLVSGIPLVNSDDGGVLSSTELGFLVGGIVIFVFLMAYIGYLQQGTHNSFYGRRKKGKKGKSVTPMFTKYLKDYFYY